MAVTCEAAQRADIPGIARLFAEAFADSVLHVCGKMPRLVALIDVFTLVYESEPTAAFVAHDAHGQVVGYVFSPADIRNLWITALCKGHLLKWLFHYLCGHYGVGLQPLKILLRNKWSFWRSAHDGAMNAHARILSVAVAGSVRNQGLGQQLLEGALRYFACRQVARVRLEVRPWNAPAQHLYEKLGFVSCGVSEDSQGKWTVMLKEME